jgi:hypothetical protein
MDDQELISGEVEIVIRQADCDKGYQQRQVKFHQGSHRLQSCFQIVPDER